MPPERDDVAADVDDHVLAVDLLNLCSNLADRVKRLEAKVAELERQAAAARGEH